VSRKRVVSDLKASSERVGRLYPVLLDRHGNIIDGQHRLTADKNWPKIKLESVKTEEQRLLARLISNVCRRHVPAEEKTELLGRLGGIYLKDGVEPKRIAEKIMEKTGMSYRWVMKYLPDKYKAEPEKGKRSKPLNLTNVKVAHRATRGDPERRAISIELEEPPKGAIAVKAYGNTNFVNVMLEKKFYRQLEETAERLETTPDKLIYNAMLLILKGLNQLQGGKNE